MEAARKKENRRAEKASLLCAVVLLVGLLGVYKYTDFLVENINLLTGWHLPLPGIALPIGISFFTFQILSYVIDVYRRDVQPQRNFLLVATYLCAFPQLIAGPVVRYRTVEKELTERTVAWDDVYAGLRLFVTGLGKKVLLANTAAVVADGIFSYTPEACGMAASWVGVLAYTMQIYFDFSGYSDMACGMGRMMGFQYPENFREPYTAVSVTDFWRRWHITMSSFFRDYVYIPLGGNRVSRVRWMLNIMTVWMLTGLWHGASWNFVVWGLYYGVLLLLEKMFWGEKIARVPVLRHLYTMLAVMIGWVFFRSETLAGAGKRLASMAGVYGMGTGKIGWMTILERSQAGGVFLLAMTAAILLSAGAGRLWREKIEKRKSPVWKQAAETGACIGSLAVLVLSVASMVSGSYNPFIYFQF